MSFFGGFSCLLFCKDLYKFIQLLVLACRQLVSCDHLSCSLSVFPRDLLISTGLESVSLGKVILGPKTKFVCKLIVVKGSQIGVAHTCFISSFEENARLLCDSRLNLERCTLILSLFKEESLCISETEIAIHCEGVGLEVDGSFLVR